MKLNNFRQAPPVQLHKSLRRTKHLSRLPRRCVPAARRGRREKGLGKF